MTRHKDLAFPMRYEPERLTPLQWLKVAVMSVLWAALFFVGIGLLLLLGSVS